MRPSMRDLLEKWVDLAIDEFGIYYYGGDVEPFYEIGEVTFLLSSVNGDLYHWEIRSREEERRFIEIDNEGNVIQDLTEAYIK